MAYIPISRRATGSSSHALQYFLMAIVAIAVAVPAAIATVGGPAVPALNCLAAGC